MERVLEVSGEAMSNLYRVAPAVAEMIPHARDIIGFRNMLTRVESAHCNNPELMEGVNQGIYVFLRVIPCRTPRPNPLGCPL